MSKAQILNNIIFVGKDILIDNGNKDLQITPKFKVKKIPVHR
jgi:hypothetical protein